MNSGETGSWSGLLVTILIMSRKDGCDSQSAATAAGCLTLTCVLFGHFLLIIHKSVAHILVKRPWLLRFVYYWTEMEISYTRFRENLCMRCSDSVNITQTSPSKRADQALGGRICVSIAGSGRILHKSIYLWWSVLRDTCGSIYLYSGIHAVRFLLGLRGTCALGIHLVRSVLTAVHLPAVISNAAAKLCRCRLWIVTKIFKKFQFLPWQ